jgi:crotonobetainyl-CoA:carnitine CoA-transferase CaiB-like acyl-CoA transferase
MSDTLKGLRVIDFTAMMAGPCCARWLADLGAEVIKVEPLDGDHMRHRPPLRQGHSSYFGHMNAGKRSIALDLKSADGLAIARRLCEAADVVIEAFRPGVMQRLGLDAETLRQRHPRLVYASISGFGQQGSAAARPAYAAVVHAASGYYMANHEYQDGAERPQNSGIPLADMLTAVFCAFSVQTALLERERTGRGSTIDVNLMDSIVNLLVYELQASQFPQPGRRPLYKPLKARDGFVIVVPVNENNFRALCNCTGHPEWLDDPLLNTDAARVKHWDEYLRRIEAWTSSRSALECEQVMSAAGVPCSRYRRLEEALQDPQFAERGSFGRVADGAGSFLAALLPFTLNGVKPAAGAQVPALGEHGPDVLKSVLGLDEPEVRRLLAAGVVAVS